jgi:hypothetical protein
MMDVGIVGGLPVFNPVLGFASITSPEITIEQYPIRQANWYFDRNVVHRASISPYTVRRGVTFYDSDFWKWSMAALSGGTAYTTFGSSYRRSFVLIHFFARNPLEGLGVPKGPLVGAKLNFGPFEFALRVPARAYLLKGCIPARWKSGNDFDAMDGSVSIAELDFTCEGVEEVSLGGAASAAVGLLTGAAQPVISSAIG